MLRRIENRVFEWLSMRRRMRSPFSGEYVYEFGVYPLTFEEAYKLLDDITALVEAIPAYMGGGCKEE